MSINNVSQTNHDSVPESFNKTAAGGMLGRMVRSIYQGDTSKALASLAYAVADVASEFQMHAPEHHDLDDITGLAEHVSRHVTNASESKSSASTVLVFAKSLQNLRIALSNHLENIKYEHEEAAPTIAFGDHRSEERLNHLQDQLNRLNFIEQEMHLTKPQASEAKARVATSPTPTTRDCQAVLVSVLNRLNTFSQARLDSGDLSSRHEFILKDLPVAFVNTVSECCVDKPVTKELLGQIFQATEESLRKLNRRNEGEPEICKDIGAIRKELQKLAGELNLTY